MNVGMTYDLREDYLAEGYGEEEVAEFDRPDTIDAIEGALRGLGFETDRIGHARQLLKRLAAEDQWDLVFNIAEGLHGFGRESLVPALLDAHEIPYTFSDPLTLCLALHKGTAKRFVRDLGLPTPDFVVIEHFGDLEKVDFPFPLFAKPVAEGTGKGITGASKIDSAGQLESVCRELLAQFRQPVLVESFLEGRELTVGIVGTGEAAEAVGAMEVLFRSPSEVPIYSYHNKENYRDRIEYRLVRDRTAERAKEVALGVWRGLGCRDAGRVDLRCDGRGEPNFMEVNPLAGLHPEHSDLPILCLLAGISFRDLISRIMTSARERMPRITWGH
jgi:D-alanine-D-alanine ligase